MMQLPARNLARVVAVTGSEHAIGWSVDWFSCISLCEVYDAQNFPPPRQYLDKSPTCNCKIALR